MWDLQAIRIMNRRSALAEDNFNRHCSYSGDPEHGIVLHSAKQRSTRHLAGNVVNPGNSPAGKFLARWLASNSVEEHDHLVESYFI